MIKENPFTVLSYHQATPFELADDSKTNHIPNYMLINIINKLLICIAWAYKASTWINVLLFQGLYE